MIKTVIIIVLFACLFVSVNETMQLRDRLDRLETSCIKGEK